jgi:hypothetical protein
LGADEQLFAVFSVELHAAIADDVQSFAATTVANAPAAIFAQRVVFARGEAF